MIFVNLNGGIGNQMFQYAFYLALSQKYSNVFIDPTYVFSEMKNLNRQTIFDNFQLNDKRAYFCKSLGLFWHDVLREHGYYRFIQHFKKTSHYYTEKDIDTILHSDLKSAYLFGYWQNEEFFLPYADIIRQAFVFKNKLPESNKPFLAMIQSEENAISLHVRLGDYEKPENQKLFVNLSSGDYYQRAIRFITDKYPNAKFFVFSNNPEKAKSLFVGEQFVFVDENDEKTGWADMYLMSQCKHNIIANSTFSWWGAWLNQYQQKNVIYPKKWHAWQNETQVCPKEWIGL